MLELGLDDVTRNHATLGQNVEDLLVHLQVLVQPHRLQTLQRHVDDVHMVLALLRVDVVAHVLDQGQEFVLVFGLVQAYKGRH